MHTEQQQKKKRPFHLGREMFEWSQIPVSGFIAVVLVVTFVCSVFTVNGSSMLQTLSDGESMLISRLFYTPKAGDIVVFSKAGLKVIDEENGRQSPYVKRVIGVEGDRIRIDYAENAVYVNDVRLDESYLWQPMGQMGSAVYETIVETGHVFVMGDNRNNSSDSRDPTVGQIDTRFILGKLILRLMPLNKIGFVK